MSSQENRVGTNVTDGVAVVMPAVGTAEVEAVDLDEEVEFDGCKEEETALYKKASATVETLHRQKGQFFLHTENCFASGEDVGIEDCLLEDWYAERLSEAESWEWLRHNCSQREQVAEKVAELDEQDGVRKPAVMQTVIENEEVEFNDCDEEVEFDGCKEEETALYKQVSATVETLHRQKGQFFLHTEHCFARGEDVWLEDCELEDWYAERLSEADGWVWLRHYCSQRKQVAEKVAELDEQDGVRKPAVKQTVIENEEVEFDADVARQESEVNQTHRP